MTPPKKRQHAARTEIPAAKTIQTIDDLLTSHGAQDFGYVRLDGGKRAAIAFRLGERTIRYAIPIPDLETFRYTKTHVYRTDEQTVRAWEQGVRSRWREVLRLVDAKLIAIASGIVTLEDEFLTWTVTADGRTVGEILGPQLDQMKAAGRIPSLGYMLSAGEENNQ